MKKLLIIILTSVLVYSCNKEEVKSTDSDNYGKWICYESYNGTLGSIEINSDGDIIVEGLDVPLLSNDLVLNHFISEDTLYVEYATSMGIRPYRYLVFDDDELTCYSLYHPDYEAVYNEWYKLKK